MFLAIRSPRLWKPSLLDRAARELTFCMHTTSLDGACCGNGTISDYSMNEQRDDK